MPGKESKRPKRKGDAGEGEEADLEENKFVVMRHSSGVGESPVAKEAEQYLTDHNGQAVPIGTPGVRGYIMPFAEEQGYFEVWSEPAGTLPNIMSTIRDRGGRLILVDSEYHRTRPSPFIAPLLNLAAVKHFAETGTLEERKYTGVWVTAPKYPLGQVLTRQQAQERYRQHAFEAAELAIKAIAGLTLAAAAESAEEHIAISTSSAAVQLDESSASASTSESSSSPSSSVKTAHDGSVQPNTIAVNPPARKSGVVEGELRFTKRKPEDSVADKTATKPQPSLTITTTARSAPSSQTVGPATSPAPAPVRRSLLQEVLAKADQDLAARSAAFKKRQEEEERRLAVEAKEQAEREAAREAARLAGPVDGGRWRVAKLPPGYISMLGPQPNGIGYRIYLVGTFHHDLHMMLSFGGLWSSYNQNNCNIAVVNVQPGQLVYRKEHREMFNVFRRPGAWVYDAPPQPQPQGKRR